jgi:YVTN family beta-propeller protein
MRPVAITSGRRRLLPEVGILALLASLAAPAAVLAQVQYVVQTNSAGDNVQLIDPATNKIVAQITGVEVVHGVAAAPDGRALYLSNESTQTLDIVDTTTLKVTNSIPLSGHPNNLAIHDNGERVYVAIQGTGGGVDVIDTVNEEHIRFIPIMRGVHNTFITPDSKYVVAGSTGGNTATVIDTELERPVWAIYFEGGVRPLTFDTNADGSTKNMYVQVTNLHGFAVVDWDKRIETRRVTQPDIPVAERNREGIQGAPAHGIKVSPDGTTLWSTSKINGHVYAYSLPDLAYLGGVKVGVVPDWLTFTLDGKFLYVANAHSNYVSVVDVAARKEIQQIPVGQVPKRNITAMLPPLPTGQ